MSGRPPPAFEDAIAGKRVDLGLLRRLLGWLVPERRALAASGLLMLVTALFQVILPVILSVVVIDHLLLGEASPAAPDLGLIALTERLAGATGASPLLMACAVYAFCQLAIGLAGHGHRMLLIGAVVSALARLREAVFLKLLRQPAAFWDKVSVGRVTTRVTNDVEALYELLRSLGTFLGEFVPFFVALGIMLSADVPLTLALLAFAPLLGALSLAFRRAMRNVYRRARESLSWLNQQMQENLAGLTVVQLYGREGENLFRYQATNGENRRDETRALALETFYGALTDSLSNLALAVTLFLGARALGAEADGLTLGTVVLFTRYIDLLFQPLAALGEQYNLLFRAMASGERIFQALDWPSLQREPATPAALPPRLTGALRFEHLSFAYEPGTPVLKNLTLTVPARSTLAIVGPTGSGKSTLIRLLSRLYTVNPGQLFIDDLDVTQIHSRELRRRIGVVLQDFHVFAGTVLDNITLGDPAITREKAKAAAATVGADGFIHALPQGFDTVLAERGRNLSQGQRQLLAFARVLATDPEILVLDEATASIDSETEAEIQAALKRLRADRTTVIIAHRLATIVDADQVLVLVNGTQEALGSLETVLTDSPTYARMHRLQFEDPEALADA
jgi:ATP-binding cassette subfamily B protein